VLKENPLPLGKTQYTFVDYGAASGHNSVLPLSTVIKSVMGHLTSHDSSSVTSGTPSFMVYLNDLLTNAWSTTFNNTLSLRDAAPNVYLYASGRSFYDQVMPDSSVDFGVSFSAQQWMSSVPKIKNHITYLLADEEELAAVKQISRKDWETWLECRAKEMRPGATLFCVLPTSIEGGTSWSSIINPLDHCFCEMVRDGLLTPAELEATSLQVYLKTFEEIVEWFNNSSATKKLKLVRTEKLLAPCPLRGMEQSVKAEKAIKQVLAVIGPGIAARLDSKRSKEERAELLDELERRTKDYLMQGPGNIDVSIPSVVAVFSRTNGPEGGMNK